MVSAEAMQKKSSRKQHLKGQTYPVRISEAGPQKKTKTQGEGEASPVACRPAVWADCSNDTVYLETCTHKSSSPSFANATTASRKSFTLKAAEVPAVANVGSANKLNHHTSNSSNSSPPALSSLVSSPLCPSYRRPSPAFFFRSPEHALCVRESPSPNPYFQHHSASASFGISRTLLTFSGEGTVRSQTAQHAAKLQRQAQSWLALGLEDFAEVLVASSEDEEEGVDKGNGGGRRSEEDIQDRGFSKTATTEEATSCRTGKKGTCDTNTSKKMYNAARQAVRKSKYLVAKSDAESSQQHQHSGMSCQRVRSFGALPDGPPRHFCSLWEVLDGSTLKHLVIQSKFKAFKFIHSRLAAFASSTNDENVHIPHTRTHPPRRSLQQNAQSSGGSAQEFCEEYTSEKHHYTSAGGNGSEPDRRRVTCAVRSPDMGNASIDGSFSSLAEQEGSGGGSATCHTVGGTTDVFKLMVDFYLSIVYLLGDKLKRELDRRLAVEQEARLLKAQLRRMEAQAKEGLEKAGREIEKVETQSETLIQEVATLHRKLNSREHKQEDLRQQYHRKLQQQRLHHETQLEEVKLQCSSLTRENDRKERQVARLRAYLQRIIQHTVDTDGADLTVQGQQRRSTLPANQSAPDAIFPPSLVVARNTTRTEGLDTKKTQKFLLAREPHFQGSADSELVKKGGTVASGSSTMLQISWLKEKNAAVGRSRQKPPLQQFCSGSCEAETAARLTKRSTGDINDFQHCPGHDLVIATCNRGHVSLPAPPHSKTSVEELKEVDKRWRTLTTQQHTLLPAAGVSFRAESIFRIRHGRFVQMWPTTTGNAHRVRTRLSSESLQKELLHAILLPNPAGQTTNGRQRREKCIHAPARCQGAKPSFDARLCRIPSASHNFQIHSESTKPEELTVAPVATCDKVDVLPLQCRRKKQQAISLRQILICTFLLAILFDISVLDSHLQAAIFRTAQWTVLLAVSGIQNLKRLQVPAQQENLWREYTDTRAPGASLFSSEVALRVRLVLLTSTERALLLALQALRALQKSDVNEGEHAAHYAELLTDQFAAFPADGICAKSLGIASERSGLFEPCAYP